MLQKRGAEGDEAEATEYLAMIADRFPKSKYYVKALSRVAWNRFAAKEYAQSIPAFTNYISTLQPGEDKAIAQFCLADAYKQTGDYLSSIKASAALIGWLKPQNSAFDTSAEVEKKMDDLQEKSVFYLGYCFSRMQEPKAAVPKLRAKGIASFKQFLKAYPKSELAPTAMSAMGGMQLELDQFDAAAATFEELTKKYPDSPEGKNASYSLLKSALEVGKKDIAREAINNMLAQKGQFQLSQYNRVGQLLLDNEMYPEAIQAFASVLAVPPAELGTEAEQRSLLERALYGSGRAHYELQQYQDAARNIQDLMTRYPKSGLFYDAKFIMAKSFKETGKYDDAVAALNDIFKYSENVAQRSEASYDLAQVQIAQMEPEAALGSLQRVALLGDASDPVQRPIIEKCIYESIPISMELGRYDDAVDSCNQYETLFPENKEKVGKIRIEKREAKRQASMKRARDEAAAAAAATATE